MILNIGKNEHLLNNDLIQKAKYYRDIILTGEDGNGWAKYIMDIDMAYINHIKELALEIRNQSELIILIGVGGSYLGGRAIIEALTPTLPWLKKGPKIIFCGYNLSEQHLNEVKESISLYDTSIVVISKSGETLEPSLAFNTIKNIMQDKYGECFKSRIVTITDEDKGILRKETNEYGYKNFIIPSNIGGRFSVFTPVGLFPMAIAGLDIINFIKGARNFRLESFIYFYDCKKDPTIQYTIIRNELYKKNKKIELLGIYEPCLYYLSEWWKQLFGESEGKEGKGLFPCNINYTTDLHSLGQYIQGGERLFFETIISIENNNETIMNNIVAKAVSNAHEFNDVPQIKITIPEINEFYLGELCYFFEISCATSAYLLGVNPYNQPDVEKYKNEIKKILK